MNYSDCNTCKKNCKCNFLCSNFSISLIVYFPFFFFKEIIEISGFVIEMYGDSRINLKTHHY